MNILQIFINGIVIGSIYLLISVGLAFTYGLLRFPNFSHAELITLGAYASLIACSSNFDFITSLPFAFAISSLIALLVHILVFSFMMRMRCGMVELMVASIGVGLVIRHVIQEVWGAKIYFLGFVRHVYEFCGVRIADAEIFIMLFSALSAIFLHLMLTRTKVGIALRASIENSSLASILGVDVERLTLFAWLVGGGFAGIGGALLAVQTRIIPQLGWEVLLSAFAVVILGGVGNLHGAILSSYLIGLCESFGLTLLVNLGISSGYKSAISFIVILLALIFKPKGLLGGEF